MATASKLVHREELDLEEQSSTSRHFEEELRQRVVGQNEAVHALVDLYQVFCAGLHSPGRPVGNLLFLGPTGSGKTRTVEAAAEILFGDGRAVIKVDCAEFQHSHEIAKLIGSPPGYLGHRENALGQLLALEPAGWHVVLDLRDVTLVNEGAVQFLAGCEADSIKLENCPLYIREWIERAKGRHRRPRKQ